MPDPKLASPILPDHIEETIRSIDRLHAEHRRDATPLQRAVDRVTTLLGRPGFILLVTAIVGLLAAQIAVVVVVGVVELTAFAAVVTEALVGKAVAKSVHPVKVVAVLPVHVTARRIPRAEVPDDDAERVAWLDALWLDVDAGAASSLA